MKKTLSQKKVVAQSAGNQGERKLPQIPSVQDQKNMDALQQKREETEKDLEQGSPSQNLVRYISENLIKSKTKKDNLKDVLSLDLSLKEGEKKIKYLEKLEDLTRLQVFHLGFNQIEKMENMDYLTKLRELDLRCNHISKIEGIETLVHLQTLDLSSNLIETIPAWMGKKLKALRRLNLAANLLYSLNDIYKLRALKDLVDFSIAGNLLCDLAHHELFIVFHLRYLTHLDGKPISQAFRKEAHDRFAQEEIENFEDQLEKEGKKFRELEGDHSKSLTEVEKSHKKIKKLEMKTNRFEEKMEELQQELQAKDDLLKRKTAELNKACQKQFRLEQELAFQRIDAKFEPLGQLMELPEVEGGTEESMYIGQAGYKRNPLVSDSSVHTPKSRTLRYYPSEEISPEMEKKLQENLDEELADKERQIDKAKEKLRELKDELWNAETNVRKAKDELEKHQQMPSDQKEIPRHIKEELINRTKVVSDLKERVFQLEEDMQRALDLVEEKEEELKQLQDALALLDEGDPRHAALQAQLADKELQAAQAEEEQQRLQRELEDSLGFLSDEMDRVAQLESQIDEGQIAVNEDLKRELQGIVGSLTDHLNHIKEQAAQQKKANNRLQKERDKLKEQLDAIKDSALDEQKRNEDLKKRLEDAEAALQELEAERDSLHGESPKRGEIAEMEEKMQQAEDEIIKLRAALQRKQQQAKVAEENLKKQMAGQERKLQALEAEAKRKKEEDEEVEGLAAEVEALKREKRDLERQKKRKEKDLQDALDSSLHPEEVAERIQEFSRGLDNLHTTNTDDPVERSLAELQNQFQKQLDEVKQEAERKERQQKEAEAEALALKRKLKDLEKGKYQPKENKTAERRADSVRSNPDDAEIQKLKDDLLHLQQAFQENDQLAAEQLEEKDQLIAELQKQLQRRAKDREKSPRDTYTRRWKEKKKPVSPTKVELAAQKRLAKAEQELAEAKEDVKQLLGALEEKEQQLLKEMEKCDEADQTLAGQEEEIKALYDTLEDQKKELLRLKEALDRMTAAPADQEAISQIQDEVDAIRGMLDGNRPIYNQMMPSAIQAQEQRYPEPHHATNAFHAPQGLGIQSVPHQVSAPQHVSAPYQLSAPHQVSAPLQFSAPHQVSVPHQVSAPQVSAGGGYPTMQPPEPTQVPVQAGHSGLPRPPMNAPQAGFSVPLTAPVSQAMASSVPLNVPYQPSSQLYPSQQIGPPVSPDKSYHVSVDRKWETTNPSQQASGNQQSSQSQKFNDRKGHGDPPQEGRSNYGSSGTPKRKKQRPEDDVVRGLFCNVPDHHHLEDELSRLEEELSRSQASKSNKSGNGLDKINKSLRAKHRELDTLKGEIKIRKDTLRYLDEQEADFRRREEEMKIRLDELKREMAKQKERRAFLEGQLLITPEEEDFLREQTLVHQDSLQDEIHCLEETLAKRRAELRQADRLLQECQQDYQLVHTKAEAALTQLNETQLKLTHTHEDAVELERRAEETAVNLVTAQEHLVDLRKQIAHLEEERNLKESEGNKMEGLLKAREEEFRELEEKIESFKDKYEQLQNEMVIVNKRTEKQARVVRENEKLLADRQAELDRVVSQIDSKQGELEKVERQHSSKQAELKSLASDVDRHRHDFMLALREGETEVSNKQQMIKDLKADIDRLQHQKHELCSDLETKRSELIDIQQQGEAAQRQLQGISADGDKHKTELKHTLEMIQIEKTELGALKLQHEARLKELEKTQLAVLEEKATLEKLVNETKKAMSALNQVKQELDRDGPNRDQMALEKKSLEESMGVLRKETELLENKHQSLQQKVEQLKRQREEIQENIEQNSHRMDRLEHDAESFEKEVKDLKEKKQALSKETQNIKEQVKDVKAELKLVNSELKDTEMEKVEAEKKLQSLLQSNVKTSDELKSVHSKLEQSCSALEEILQQEREGKERLRALREEMERRVKDVEEKETEIRRLEEKNEAEKRKLNKTVHQLSVKADSLQNDIDVRQRELDNLQQILRMTKTEMEQQNVNLQKYQSFDETLKNLQSQLRDEDREKVQYLEALEKSQRETELIKKENSRLSGSVSELEGNLDAWKRKLKQANAKYDLKKQSLMKEISELTRKADAQTDRADRLFQELNLLHQKHAILQQQIADYESEKKDEIEVTSRLQELRSEIRSEFNEKMEDLEATRLEVLEELQEVAGDKEELGTILMSEAAEESLPLYQRKVDVTKDSGKRFQEEQEKLKLQIQEQMSKKASLLELAQQRTKSSLDGLHKKMHNLEELYKKRKETKGEGGNLRSGITHRVEVEDGDRSFHISSDEEDSSDDGRKKQENSASTHSYSELRRGRKIEGGSSRRERSVHWDEFMTSLNDAKVEATEELRRKKKRDWKENQR